MTCPGRVSLIKGWSPSYAIVSRVRAPQTERMRYVASYYYSKLYCYSNFHTTILIPVQFNKVAYYHVKVSFAPAIKSG